MSTVGILIMQCGYKYKNNLKNFDLGHTLLNKNMIEKSHKGFKVIDNYIFRFLFKKFPAHCLSDMSWQTNKPTDSPTSSYSSFSYDK